ncbi:hypothetical protein BC826DRAFT_1056155 [Russula brevipes]|nr:hypothetical protein BC826DRAFT_1056155 [Russula brevipes]
MLDVWPPALPMRIENSWLQLSPMEEADTLIAALEHRDRVCRMDLRILPHFPSERFVAVLDEPFPALTYLGIEWSSNDSQSLALPSLNLDTISFPAVPALLLSAGGLVHLSIWDIPESGYFPPESLGASLTSLTALEFLRVGFQYPRSPPDQVSRRPPPPARTTLPALTYLGFRGESEYLDDLVAWIEAPPLHSVEITFFNQPLFSISQLSLFIDRAEHLNTLKEGIVAFLRRSAEIDLSGRSRTGDHTKFSFVISRTATQRILLSSLVQVFNSSWPLMSTLESFTIKKDWGMDNDRLTEDIRWLELLRPLTGLKTLYLSESPALQVVRELQLQEQLAGEGETKMLPALHALYFEGLRPWTPIPETIRPVRRWEG